MIIVMRQKAPEKNVEHVLDELGKYKGLDPKPLHGTERTVIAVIGDERVIDQHHISSLPGVEKVMLVLEPYRLVSRETKHEQTIVQVGDVKIGGKAIAFMAGPCSVENEDQMEKAAAGVKKLGAHMLRGGAFKPRSSPHAFQGMGRDGVKLLSAAGKHHNIPTVSEIMDVREIDFMAEHIDMLQIGARNMQNFDLLKEVGKTQKPVLLKRGMSATIKEWLLAAEYILSNGNNNVVLCERGIRTFEEATRNTLAIAAVPLIHELSHLPIIVDPSHGTGMPSLMSPMTRAALAAGADGIMLEVHPNPEVALCDADQALTFDQFGDIVEDAKAIIAAVNRTM
jgi:3-deoxy-7-phosphoheptulonate synthase